MTSGVASEPCRVGVQILAPDEHAIALTEHLKASLSHAVAARGPSVKGLMVIELPHAGAGRSAVEAVRALASAFDPSWRTRVGIEPLA